MRSLAKLVSEHLLATLCLVGMGLATPRVAFAEKLVESPEAAATENDPNDVTPPAATDEVRGGGCTNVCLNSGEDPYRCEEDCVFVTDKASEVATRIPACEG